MLTIVILYRRTMHQRKQQLQIPGYGVALMYNLKQRQNLQLLYWR